MASAPLNKRSTRCQLPTCRKSCRGRGLRNRIQAGQNWQSDRAASLSGYTGGTSPSWPVILDNAGNIYGTAGGGSGYNGIVFKLDKRDQETVLYNFSYDDGSPFSGLLRDAKGNLYGTAVQGSSYEGTVYKLDKSGKLTILHDFTGYADGGFPHGTLIIDEDGNPYGTARDGGISGSCDGSGCGVVFKITP